MSAGKIDTAAEVAALRDCAAAVIRAGDGRGVRGARLTCRAALIRAGHSPGMADSLAGHCAAWARDWWARAAVRLADDSSRAEARPAEGAAS